MNTVSKNMVVVPVVEQHAEDATVCALRRRFALDAGHLDLTRLSRLDELLIAHVDGLRVAGDAGLEIAFAAMSADVSGSGFAPVMLSLEREDKTRLQRILTLFSAAGRLQSEVAPAFCWMVAMGQLEPEDILDSTPTPEQICLLFRALGPRHRDRYGIVQDGLSHANSTVRAEAAQAAGRLGLVDLTDRMRAGFTDPDPEARFWFSWAAVLLGHRGPGLEVLVGFMSTSGPLCRTAWLLGGPALDVARATSLLKELALQPGAQRQLIAAVGSVGRSGYVSWLIRQMSDPALARCAGEAFSLITGLDLAMLDLDRAPPEDEGATPNENAADDRVDMDSDDGLPWPAPAAIGSWWQANEHRYPADRPFFLGMAPSQSQCLEVLADGYQRQRRAAAVWWSLLRPGTPLFPVDAPVALQRGWIERALASGELAPRTDGGSR